MEFEEGTDVWVAMYVGCERQEGCLSGQSFAQ